MHFHDVPPPKSYENITVHLKQGTTPKILFSIEDCSFAYIPCRIILTLENGGTVTLEGFDIHNSLHETFELQLRDGELIRLSDLYTATLYLDLHTGMDIEHEKECTPGEQEPRSESGAQCASSELDFLESSEPYCAVPALSDPAPQCGQGKGIDGALAPFSRAQQVTAWIDSADFAITFDEALSLQGWLYYKIL